MSKIFVYDFLLIYFIVIIDIDIYIKILWSLFYYTKFLVIILYINWLIILKIIILAKV